MPRTPVFLYALWGLLAGASLAQAEPLRQAQFSTRIEGEMLRIALPNPTPPPKASRARLDEIIASSCLAATRKDPRFILAWLEVALEPRVMTALASTPSVGGVTPETARNVAEFSDPVLYLRWLLTGTDPVYFKAIVERVEAQNAVDASERRAWRRLPGIEALPSRGTARY